MTTTANPQNITSGFEQDNDVDMDRVLNNIRMVSTNGNSVFNITRV